MSSPVATVDDGVGGTPITAIHPDIIQSHVLNRLDGPTLTSTSCVSGEMLALCDNEYLWKNICNDTWPSTVDRRLRNAVGAFPSGHRSFFSDSFPAHRHHQLLQKTCPTAETPELISAVDIYFDGRVIFSKVLITVTQSKWFLCTPFQLDLLDPKEAITFVSSGSTSVDLAVDRLRVSWIVIDPAKNRAINVASRSAVEFRRYWLIDDVQFRFTTVVSSAGEPVQCGVVVTCDSERVMEVSMRIEDGEGKILTGREGLGVLAAAMEGEKVKLDRSGEKEVYEAFVRMKVQFMEKKKKRERRLDMACVASGVFIFVAGLVWAVFWRR